MIDTKERVIAYYSRHLSVTEQNYSTTEKECLAVVNAVKHFRPYLLGRHFTLIVDHQPLEYLKKAKDTNRRVNRWSLELASYDYTIKYRKGRIHNNADALSRIPKESKEIEQINQIQIINQSERMKELQSKDEFCNEIIKFLTNGDIENNKEPFWMKQIGKFKINDNGLLVREMEPIGNRRKYLTMNVVVPKSIRNEITTTFHDELLGGHLGYNKTYNKIRDRFYWPKMSKDIKQYCASCVPCAIRKPLPKKKKAPLQPMPLMNNAFEKVALDILGPLRQTENGNQYVLVMSDYLTRWVEAFPLKCITAQAVADVFVNYIICRHGTPKILLTDQGSNFKAQLFANICGILKIKRQFTSAYHPATDGLVERFNKTFAQMMSHYINEYHSDWDNFIPKIVFAYNTSVQESTMETPFFLLYGRDPIYPIDVLLQSDNYPYLDMKDYKSLLMKKLKIAQKLAKENLSEAQKKQKKYYDNKAKENNFEIGDQVYLTEESIPKERTKKFYRKWTGPYRIIDQIGDNLYEINQSQSEKSFIVHSNRLKFCIEERPWNTANTTDQRSQTKKTTDPGSLFKRKKNETDTKKQQKTKDNKIT